MEYYKNLELESITYFDDEGRYKVEIWKDVVGYEEFYMVSDLGRLKSLKRKSNNFQSIVYKKEIIKKQAVISKGYLSTSLTDKFKKTKTKYIHLLIGEAFLGHNPDGTTKLIVDHIDNNPLNCNILNLQIITHRENCSKDKIGSSKFVGVHYRKNRGSWIASISIRCHVISIASFREEHIAAKAYNIALSNIDNYNGNDKDFKSLIKSLL